MTYNNATAEIIKCIKVYTTSQTRTVTYVAPITLDDPKIIGYQCIDTLKVTHPYGDPIFNDLKVGAHITVAGKKFSRLTYDGNEVILE